MKTSIINPFARLGVASTPGWVLPALIAVLNLLPAGRVTAQTFTTLHSFTDDTDGASPYAGLITNSSGNTLYGMAANAGSWSAGTVFAVHTDGTGFTNLYSFSEGAQDPSSGDYTNSDGAGPFAQLILSGNTLYGTARYGGSGSVGTVFAANTDGTGFTNLHSFTAFLFPPVNTNSDGAYPGGLILSGNTLYGTAGGGGSSDNGNGTLFAINTDGSGFTNLHNFSATSTNASGVYTNSDGIYPNDKLVVSGNTLYG